MSDIEWVDPPENLGSRRLARAREISRVVAEMREHPGKWARVATGVKSNTGRQSWIKRGCETRSAKTAAGFDVYARWPES